MRRATTDEVLSALVDPDAVVVDARENCAYIGWSLDGVARGGHIEGAVDFSAVWLSIKPEDAADHRAHDEQLARAAEAKGLTAAKRAIVYDATGEESVTVAEYLGRLGVEDVSVYDVRTWADDADLPMRVHPNHHLLVPASFVAEVIAGDDWSIFECGWGALDDYRAAHIPGAVYLDTDEVEARPLWKRRSVGELEQFARANGITADTNVLLYGADQMAAFRVRAVLTWMGVRNVRVLNGGLAAWERAGYRRESGANPKIAGGSFGAPIPSRPEHLVDIEDARSALVHPADASLVDIRSWAEHAGEIVGYDDIEIAGRPSGARWGGDMPSNHTNIDGTMRNFSETLAAWAEHGIAPHQRLVFFCGTGWRASQMLLYAEVAGLERIHVWDSGWYEWITDAANPRCCSRAETGQRKGGHRPSPAPAPPHE